MVLPLLVISSIFTSRALVQGHGLFAVVEVASVHVRAWSFATTAPLGHAVGFLRAYSLTALGARRSELPSRSTGFTAEPMHLL